MAIRNPGEKGEPEPSKKAHTGSVDMTFLKDRILCSKYQMKYITVSS